VPTDASHRPRLPDAVRALVAQAHRETVAAHGDLGLDLAAFEERVVTNARRHVDARPPAAPSTPDGAPSPPDDAAVFDHVRHAALADVCLAVAADRGSDRAWTALSDGWRTRLEGFAVRRGASSADAVAIVQDLFGDLAMPPSDGRARTLLGTFDGTGSLFGWLSIVLLRRLAGRARGRKTQSLDALEPAEREAAAPPRVAVPSDPREDAEHREGIARFEHALAAAWATLSDQERLALLFKHRDALSQRQAGHLLGVGEARVSRIVTAALDKLRHAARATFSDDGGAALSPDAWRALEAVVARHLARNPADPHPSSGGTSHRTPPTGGTGADRPRS